MRTVGRCRCDDFREYDRSLRSDTAVELLFRLPPGNENKTLILQTLQTALVMLFGNIRHARSICKVSNRPLHNQALIYCTTSSWRNQFGKVVLRKCRATSDRKKQGEGDPIFGLNPTFCLANIGLIVLCHCFIFFSCLAVSRRCSQTKISCFASLILKGSLEVFVKVIFSDDGIRYKNT